MFLKSNTIEWQNLSDPAIVQEIIEAVVSAVNNWPLYAKMAGIPKPQMHAIGKGHRITL